MSILNWLTRLARYYTKLGFNGLLFLFKIKVTGQKKIHLHSSKYTHPIAIRNKTTDIYPFHQILISEEYNFKIGFEPEVIFDLGANIGLASVYFKNKYPKAKIVAVEPENGNYQLLLENIIHYPDIAAYPFGIWNKSTHLIVKDNGLGNWGFSVEEAAPDISGSIKATSIHELMALTGVDHIDLLKIDIEGSEKELFELNTEQWLPKVKIIIIELHDVLKLGASHTFFKAIEGYDFQLIQQGENLIIYLDRTLFKNSISNSVH